MGNSDDRATRREARQSRSLRALQEENRKLRRANASLEKKLARVMGRLDDQEEAAFNEAVDLINKLNEQEHENSTKCPLCDSKELKQLNIPNGKTITRCASCGWRKASS